MSQQDTNDIEIISKDKMIENITNIIDQRLNKDWKAAESEIRNLLDNWVQQEEHHAALKSLTNHDVITSHPLIYCAVLNIQYVILKNKQHESSTRSPRSNSLKWFESCCKVLCIKMEHSQLYESATVRTLVRSLAQAIGGDFERANQVFPVLHAIVDGFVSQKKHKLHMFHAEYLQIALVAKRHFEALQILDRKFYIADLPEADTISRFYYYGGRIYALEHRYNDAIRMYYHCLLYPVSSAKMNVPLMAYAELLLVSLIICGVKPSIPQYAPHEVAQCLRVRGERFASLVPFEDLAEVFAKGDPSKLDSCIATNSVHFQHSNVTGLVHIVKQYMIIHRLKNLSKVYVTLSFEDFRLKMKLPSETCVESWIFDTLRWQDTICLKVDAKNQFVAFESVCDVDMDAQVAKYMLHVSDMLQELQNLDKEVSLLL